MESVLRSNAFNGRVATVAALRSSNQLAPNHHKGIDIELGGLAPRSHADHRAQKQEVAARRLLCAISRTASVPGPKTELGPTKRRLEGGRRNRIDKAASRDVVGLLRVREGSDKSYAGPIVWSRDSDA
jgi:hypothetical protein